jgi:cation diffusion facilitator CzcD-associated flavoprotein CzcO
VGRNAIVIGAGFGGIGAAITLKDAGVDVTVVERAGRPGGVWRDNDYPGSACDVQSYLYSYSFAQKRDWTRRFARQPEILDYITSVIDDFGLAEHIRYDAEVVGAAYLDDQWQVTLASGESLRADLLVAACGQMSTPDTPQLPGLDDFRGPVFHSARWRHDVDLSGRDVTVIGTGSSAIQFVPEIAKTAKSVTVLQRSPGYVLDKVDVETDEPVPLWRHRLDRYRLFLTKEVLSVRVNHWPALLGPVERRYREQLLHKVPEEHIRTKLSTTDRFGCKRLLVSDNWFDTVRLPHVHLCTDAIERIGDGFVRTTGGEIIPSDVLVFGTGFRSTDFLHGITVLGRDGTSLHDRWADGAGAYLGMTVPGFPNFFLIYGPNTNVGHNSILFMIESQLNYLRSAVRRLDRHGWAAMEVRAGVAEKFDRAMQRRSRRTVYAQGCRNWFTTPTGRHTQNWPGSAVGYWLRTRRIRPRDYLFTRVRIADQREPSHAAR